MRTKLEIWIVLALSLGQSAVYSIASLIRTLTSAQGLAGSSVTINGSLSSNPAWDLVYQLLGILFSLAPVALALYLLDGREIGLGIRPIGKNLAQSFALAALIGIPGLALYLVSRALGLSAQVVTENLGAFWWTTPVLLLAALAAGLLEEIVVVGYLFDRLAALGTRKWPTIVISAAIRGSYHLYQGFGGFVGNFAMGIVFGYFYKRYGRLTPLVVAHFILDAVSFVGYAWAKTFIAGI